ncbi:hypothetical protein [Pseudomonas costantinii]|uniref:Gp5/Type VI secretion system Vgr protein OB-fold domain-containing protein n=1 Tax=Pseudomonas costantinii TaxID=168469 RepID=A0A1S2V6J0_9PSED|nr:hypothetical protein [Pseudomonas costantinii]OIN54272.1 hypothetical protein BFL40_06095 [Pseudomonas costantinii]SED65170.1 hypothetical protein SAMN04515675_1896 [Pseudomonas costantinii]
MDDAIRRSVERQFPELTGGYHLPCFGRVVAVPDAPAAPGLCDDFRPRFGVDVEVLLPDGEPDPALPILTGLPLPAPMGGQEAGMFGFPEEGTTVVVSFAYGLPHKPFITQILPHGLSLPRVPKGDQVWQHSEACQQRVDADGNWLRQTDGKIQDKAIEREVEALQNNESFQSHTRTVDDHSSESVGGIKTVEALGALKLLSGGSASLAAVDDLHQATGRDLNLVVGQKHNATVGGDMEEKIQGLRKSVAAVSQRLVAPTTWLGSEGVNMLQVLCDLLDLVQQMNIALAKHTHLPGPMPAAVDAESFTSMSISAGQLSVEMKKITL